MCFLIRCKTGPRPPRQGPWRRGGCCCLPLRPRLSLPAQRAGRRPLCLERGAGPEQIGGTYAISCRRAQGADALSPNRFSCYQLGRGSGRGGGRSAGAPRGSGGELTFHGCFRRVETEGSSEGEEFVFSADSPARFITFVADELMFNVRLRSDSNTFKKSHVDVNLFSI